MVVAMVVVVLVGLMGASLLVFVTTDLQTVAEVNRGQQAMEMAETGLKAAKVQLMDYPDPRSYDPNSSTAAYKNWAMCEPGVSDSACTSSMVNQAAGRSITMDGRTATVRIRKAPSPISTATQTYFEVTSESTVNGSRRKVQAYYRTAGWGIRAYYTPGSVYISGDDRPDESISYKLYDRVDMRGVSIFAGRDVLIGDNYPMKYRQRGSSTIVTDSVAGGGYRGLNSGANPYCVYENVRRPTDSNTYTDYYDAGFCTNTNSRFLALPTNDFTPQSDYPNESATMRGPSSFELPPSTAIGTTVAATPQIRIAANIECPEMFPQYTQNSSGRYSATLSPDYHEDALLDWAVAPFNTVARPDDPTQTNTGNTIGSSAPAPCQPMDSSNNLAAYPSVNAETGEPTRYYDPAGIAAEGKICRVSDREGTTDRCRSSATSIATIRVGDTVGGAGRIGFDGTTTPSFHDNYDVCTPAGASCAAQSGYISYPFDYKDGPDVASLLDLAKNQASTDSSGTVLRASRYVNMNSSSSDYLNLDVAANWDKLYPAGNRLKETVVFIDANGRDLEMPWASEPKQGILVVRCGNLTNLDNFSGIVVLLTDTYSGSPSASTCNRKGNYRTGKPGMNAFGPDEIGQTVDKTIDINGYVYAEGIGDSTSSNYKFGISISDGSNVDRLPKSYGDLVSIVGNGLQGVVLDSWRECYNDICTQ